MYKILQRTRRYKHGCVKTEPIATTDSSQKEKPAVHQQSSPKQRFLLKTRIYSSLEYSEIRRF